MSICLPILSLACPLWAVLLNFSSQRPLGHCPRWTSGLGSQELERPETGTEIISRAICKNNKASHSQTRIPSGSSTTGDASPTDSDMASNSTITAPPGQMPFWDMLNDAAMDEGISLPAVQEHTVQADGVSVFYRHAGPTDSTAPTILLLHGFSSSSFMYRGLMPYLAGAGYRVVAPDLPGSGFTDVPRARRYAYTFANLTATLEAFVDALALDRFAIYVFDHGAPVGFRLALRRPDAVTAIVTQNGNVYAEGLRMPFWDP
uniref:AB hydrolase-1 domain-containing protein n=1 Tax=Magnaporthiopsis poae (strain ATCC 64411 / 73-15) TaxID=644358 RepID=A0A0C4E503_MAGP6